MYSCLPTFDHVNHLLTVNFLVFSLSTISWEHIEPLGECVENGSKQMQRQTHCTKYTATQADCLTAHSFMFMLNSDPNHDSVVELLQSRWFVTYFRCFFTPERQCQSICIIYQHLQRSLAVTKYLDCGSIFHCRAAHTMGCLCRDVYILVIVIFQNIVVCRQVIPWMWFTGY